jgi:chromosome segregation ATPase
VFELEEQLELMRRKVASLERRATDLKAEVERLEQLRRELRAEIVPYERGGQLIRTEDLKGLKIPVAHQRRSTRQPEPES